MKIDIKHVAKLANLELKPDEEEKFEAQITNILDYVEKINSAQVKGTEPTSQVTGLTNVIRDDSTSPSLTQEEALSGTDNKENGMFKVTAILSDE